MNQKPRPPLGLSAVLNLGIGLVFAVAGAIVVLLVNRDRVIVAPLKPALPDGAIARPLEHQIAALAAGVALFTQ